MYKNKPKQKKPTCIKKMACILGLTANVVQTVISFSLQFNDHCVYKDKLVQTAGYFL